MGWGGGLKNQGSLMGGMGCGSGRVKVVVEGSTKRTIPAFPQGQSLFSYMILATMSLGLRWHWAASY